MTATRAPHRIDPHTDRETRLCCDNNMISPAGNHKDFEETRLPRWIVIADGAGPCVSGDRQRATAIAFLQD